MFQSSVRLKDRGPFLPKMDIEKRIDLSYGAAIPLDMLHDGRQRVRVSVPMPRSRPDIERKEPAGFIAEHLVNEEPRQ